ncbi:MAG TPA: hypothetical protein VGM89_01130 [Puia sp.]|jgi:hypothetical protein
MNPQDYQCSITTSLTPAEAFDKISRVGEWWAVNFKGDAKNLHDRFTVHFARTTWSLMEIAEAAPDQRIVWKVVDCHLPIFKDPSLWKGHRIAWEISREGLLTRVTMTHIGLVPGVECYEDCRKGWGFYVGESLLRLFTDGKGLPGSGIFAEIFAGDRKYEGLLFSRSEDFPDFADGYILLDVRENSGERVLRVHSVTTLDRSRMTPDELQGDYYMLLENRSVYEKISPLEDLQRIAQGIGPS